MPHHANITVLGGLPVTVTYTIQGPEPDVGIMSSWVEEFEITHIAGRKVKGNRANWLYTSSTRTNPPTTLPLTPSTNPGPTTANTTNSLTYQGISHIIRPQAQKRKPPP